MPSVQIKNVPPDVHRVLRARAAKAGQSLQEHMLALLIEYANTPTLDDIYERARQRWGHSGITAQFAVETIRADRDSR